MGDAKQQVVVVDDEKSILMCMRRLLRHPNYEVHCFQTPTEALDFCTENEVHLVLSDMRMPMMNGAELLRQIEELRPVATRIILSGYSERDSLMEAINGGHIWSFIPKPWDNEALKLTVENGLARAQDKMDRLKLMEELERKNLALSELNERLEQEVKERTEEVEMKSVFLQSILDDDDMEAVNEKVMQYLSSKVGATVQFLQGEDSGSLAPGCLLVSRHGRVLGVLRTQGQVLEAHRELIQRFVPVVALASSMGQCEVGAEALHDQIDDLMKSI